jgi:hypothetical protein
MLAACNRGGDAVPMVTASAPPSAAPPVARPEDVVVEASGSLAVLGPEIDPLVAAIAGKSRGDVVSNLTGLDPKSAERFSLVVRKEGEWAFVLVQKGGGSVSRGADVAFAESIAMRAPAGLDARLDATGVGKLADLVGDPIAPLVRALSSLEIEVRARSTGGLDVTLRGAPLAGGALADPAKSLVPVDTSPLASIPDGVVLSAVGSRGGPVGDASTGSALPRSGDAVLDAALEALERALGARYRFGLAWDGGGPTLFVGEAIADEAAGKIALAKLREATKGPAPAKLAKRAGLRATFDVTRLPNLPEDLLRVRFDDPGSPKQGAQGALLGPAGGWLVLTAGRSPADTFRALHKPDATTPAPGGIPKEAAFALVTLPERALAAWEGRPPLPTEAAWISVKREGMRIVVRASLPERTGKSLATLLDALRPHVQKGLGRVAALGRHEEPDAEP